MTFQGNPPIEPQAPAPPSELELAHKWDTCIETTIKHTAIGVLGGALIFFFFSM
jgi:Domain of unknown function (DUF543)